MSATTPHAATAGSPRPRFVLAGVAAMGGPHALYPDVPAGATLCGAEPEPGGWVLQGFVAEDLGRIGCGPCRERARLIRSCVSVVGPAHPGPADEPEEREDSVASGGPGPRPVRLIGPT